MNERDITRANAIEILKHHIETGDNELLAKLLPLMPGPGFTETDVWRVFDYIPDDTDSGDNYVVRDPSELVS